MSKNHRVDIIEWLDAVSVDAWTDREEIEHQAQPIVSIGILVEENDEVVTLALNHDTARDAYSCIMCIPKGMITRRRVVGKRRQP